MQTLSTLRTRASAVRETVVRRVRDAVSLGPRAVRGAAFGLLAVAALGYLAMVIRVVKGPLVFALAAGLALVLMGGLLLFLGQGLATLVNLLHRIPWTLRWALFGGLALLFVALMGFDVQPFLLAAGVLLAGGGLAGAGLGALARTGPRPLTGPQRGVAVVALAAGLLLLAGSLAWYAWPGVPATPVPDAAALSGEPVARVGLPDPGQPGPYPVRTLSYGAGTDRWRREYGAQVDLQTQPVDGSRLLSGSWEGLTGRLRSLTFGIDPRSLPLNARVWYPDGEGPFPLVLMAHGNHPSTDFSDPGYAYLGELLASRGFIFASVDMNFINGGVTDLFDRISDENDARGWLLLEHLRLWRDWNAEAGNPFQGKVDLENIAVAGHSRGGEAAAIAALFNRLPYYPDNFAQKFDYGFNIRAVVAIAPIDGQYNPAWRGTRLEDVNYFVLQGSHDADVDSFDGLNQYERVVFDPASDGFKAALYVYRANHGQFNTVWGSEDVGGLKTGFLNRAALLSGEEQRQIAKVYISAFLEAALRGQRGYLPLFQDARAAGEGWLPDTITIHRFDQAGDRHIATYEEDFDLLTTSAPGGSIRGMGLAIWREQRVHNKWEGSETSGVYLGWDESATGTYSIYLPEEGFDLDGGESLIFNLGDANQDPPSRLPPDRQAEQEASAGGQRQPVDLTIVLEDADGRSARLPLSRYRLVQPQLESQLYKVDLLQENARSEPVLQSYALPLADFAAANPAFDPARLSVIRFTFDRTRRGSLILDAVGFRE